MGKKTRQLDFEAYAADRNTLAPFRHALHATGITDKDQQKDEQALTLELLLTGICGEVNKSLSASANDNQAKSDDGTNAAKTPILDLETLLNTNIAALLQPFVEKSDSKGPMSMLDVVTLGLTDTPDIIGFLRRHGVDLSDDRDLIYACNVLDEAIEFYDEVIAEKKARVTQKIKTPKASVDFFRSPLKLK